MFCFGVVEVVKRHARIADTLFFQTRYRTFSTKELKFSYWQKCVSHMFSLTNNLSKLQKSVQIEIETGTQHRYLAWHWPGRMLRNPEGYILSLSQSDFCQQFEYGNFQYVKSEIRCSLTFFLPTIVRGQLFKLTPPFCRTGV